MHVAVMHVVRFWGLKHPWVSFAFRVGSFKDDRYVFIVMEVVSGGEMFTHLRRARKFSDEQSARVMLRSVRSPGRYRHRLHRNGKDGHCGVG